MQRTRGFTLIELLVVLVLLGVLTSLAVIIGGLVAFWWFGRQGLDPAPAAPAHTGKKKPR